MGARGKQPAVSVEVLAADYTAGMTTHEIAHKYGCSFQNVAYRLKAAGVEMRRRKYHEQICPVCGAPFTPDDARQYTCSKTCGYTAMRRGRKAYCKRGHLLVEENLYPRYSDTDVPRCRLCATERARERRKTDPEYRERVNEQARAWRQRKREEAR